MGKEADPLYYSPNSGYAPPEGYTYAWGVTWSSNERIQGRTSNHVYLLIRAGGNAEQARNEWQNNLEEAVIEVFNYNGYLGNLGSGNSPIRLSEAETLVTKLNGVLNHSGTILDDYDKAIQRTQAEAISRFLEPRISIAAGLTSEQRRSKIPLSEVDKHLPVPPTKYFQGMFPIQDFEALEVAGMELNIPVLILAVEEEKLPNVLVEIRGNGDLTEFWNAFNILRDQDPNLPSG